MREGVFFNVFIDIHFVFQEIVITGVTIISFMKITDKLETLPDCITAQKFVFKPFISVELCL